MILPRSRRNGNAAQGRWLAGMVLMMAGLALTGCASQPRIPANVILHDAHNNGYALAFDGESKTLASGGSEGRIRLWSLPEGKALGGWTAHDGSLQGMQFLNHDREILSAGYDGVLARWTRDGKLLQRLATPSPITDMVAHPSGAGFWLVGEDGGVFAFGSAQYFGGKADYALPGRIVAVQLVPYPPGIPIMMPGERVTPEKRAVVDYLLALQHLDNRFPGFEHDTHGIEVERDRDGKSIYMTRCLKA